MLRGALGKIPVGWKIGTGVIDNNQPSVGPVGMLQDAGETSLELSRRAVHRDDNIHRAIAMLRCSDDIRPCSMKDEIALIYAAFPSSAHRHGSSAHADVVPCNSEKVLGAELRRNHTFAHSDHFLLAQSILESKQPGNELLRVAQRNQPLISQNRVRYLEG